MVVLGHWEPTCYVILGNPIEDTSFCILWISFVEKAWNFIYDADQMELYSTRVLTCLSKTPGGCRCQSSSPGLEHGFPRVQLPHPMLHPMPPGCPPFSRMFAVTDMHLQVGNQVPSLWIFLVVSFLTCRWISKPCKSTELKLTHMECSGPFAFDSRILWCDERKQHHLSSHQICLNFSHPFEDHFQGNCLFAAGVSPREPAIAVGASMSFGGEA